MSIKKSLLALAAAALASMAFVPSALGGTGTVVDTPNGTAMPAGEKVHYQGWAKFEGIPGSVECHVTAETEAINDTTATVTTFTVPDTHKCTYSGTFSGCTMTSDKLEDPKPTVTAAKEDFDVKEVKIENTFTGCPVTKVTLNFSTLTLQPLATGVRTVTNTSNTLGGTAKPGTPYAGVEISGSGTAHSEQHIIFVPTTSNNAVTASGELEVTGTDRCTWTIKK